MGAPIRLLLCPSDAPPESGQFEYNSPDPSSPTYKKDFPQGRYDAVCSYGANWGTHQLHFPNPAIRAVEKDGGVPLQHSHRASRT